MGLADDFVLPPHEETPPPPEPIPQSRRATVEEVPDEDDPQNFGRFVEPYEDEESGRPAAGRPLRRGETLFERMRAQQQAAGESEFSPFHNGDEWELARWLSKNVNQSATEEYLDLPTVSQFITHCGNSLTVDCLDQESQPFLPQQPLLPSESRQASHRSGLDMQDRYRCRKSS
jgi:hypothetical protein